MACLNCELRRAKLRTLALLAFGSTLDEIAIQLSNRHGVAYFVEHERMLGGTMVRILRISQQSPYIPHIIYEKKIEHVII